MSGEWRWAMGEARGGIRSSLLTRHFSLTTRRGFSLLEMLIVITIIPMLAGVALPRYAQFSAHQQVEAAARRVAVDLAYARRRAMAASAGQSVVFNVAKSAYVLTGFVDPDHPANEYAVELDEEPYGARILSAVFGVSTTLQYTAYGEPALGAGGSVVIAVGPYTKTVTVDNVTGRVEVN